MPNEGHRLLYKTLLKCILNRYAKTCPTMPKTHPKSECVNAPVGLWMNEVYVINVLNLKARFVPPPPIRLIFSICWNQVKWNKELQWWTVWPDLAKFRHLGKTYKVFGYYLRVYFVFCKILTLIGQMFMILDKFSLLLMVQYWKDNLANWSHQRVHGAL